MAGRKTGTELWRICRAAHADLSGTGARLYGGRWNAPGLAMVYCADSPALAVLEVLVHLDIMPSDYQLMRIAFPAGSEPAPERVETPPDDPAAFGSVWLSEGRSALLSVPSVIVPECRNILINPAHPAAAGLEIISARPFRFDRRLLTGV